MNDGDAVAREASAAGVQRATGPGPILSIRSLYAGYGGSDVLRGVALDVPRGGITCVVGPNGAGKSTLLAVISGVLKARLGEITFAGESIAGLTPREILRRGVVQVTQSHSLFPAMTVRENVEMGGYLLDDRALVKERYERIADSFQVVRERETDKAGSLSGGQQRLVEFARCLMLEPELIVLDEPSMGLDPMTLRTVFETVRKMNADGRTILLVEQNARAGLKLSTHGVVLENGIVRLAASGAEILRHPEIGALYLGGSVPARSEQ